ncbi:MAG: hypothetical protein KDH17_21860 [Rhodocyclaceae bacterium]|nr:hypothetical protein [Rhodocyclaceae bacterium]
MDARRRLFLRSGVQKVAQATVDVAAHQLATRPQNWFRPPFATDEWQFLELCTRCDECLAACPHEVLFPLPARLGPRLERTPAMDLLHKGCHLCADWPCVKACETGALALPSPDATADEEEAPGLSSRPLLALAAIDTSTCLPYLGPECGACADACPVPGALRWQGPRPFIEPQICVGCARCREACIVEPKAVRLAVPDANPAP